MINIPNISNSKRLLETSTTRLCVAISIGVFSLISYLGYWDIEELRTFGYSVGARFGSSGAQGDKTEALIYTLWGVPILDFGIIGGYRLPFQGSINTGPFWMFSNFVPTEVILAGTHLVSMIIAGLAYSNIWKRCTSHIKSVNYQRSLSVTLTWVALNYPTLEYTLDQDWISTSISYQGFLAVMSGVFSLTLFESDEPYPPSTIKHALTFMLLGLNLMLLGHLSLLPLYFPPLVVISTYVLFRRRRTMLADLSQLSLFSFLGALLLCVTIRAFTVLFEVLSELVNRTQIVTNDVWWADPLKSLGSFRHFLGQLIASEFQPWFKIFWPEFLDKFGLSSRTPHLAVSIFVLVAAFFRVRQPVEYSRILMVIVIVWLTQLLIMVGILPEPLRVPTDTIARDVLLALALFGACIVICSNPTQETSRFQRAVPWILISVTTVTSVFLTVSYPAFHFDKFGGVSEYALVESIRDPNAWIETIYFETGVQSGTIAVIDDVFLTRWTDLSRDPFQRNWRDLRGEFELRQAGYSSIQGYPKMRDATAFSGAYDSFQQEILPLGVSACTTKILSFLQVRILITSTETRDNCLNQIENSHSNSNESSTKLRFSPLADSGYWFTVLDTSQVFSTSEWQPNLLRQERCGITTDSTCMNRLGLSLSTSWRVSDERCDLPCVLRISRLKTSSEPNRLIVLPINSGNGLKVQGGMDQGVFSQTSLNGLIAIREEDLNSDEVTINVVPDIRMWLQVLTAYSQLVLAIPISLYPLSLVRNSGTGGKPKFAKNRLQRCTDQLKNIKAKARSS